jgi:hypothetical protein
MSSSRRLYLYSVSLVTLLAALAGLLNLSGELIRLLTAGWGVASALAALTRGPVAPWLPVTGLALVLWILHWTLADRPARRLTMAAAVERASEVRKATLYAGQTATLAAALLQAVQAVYELLAPRFGRPPQAGNWPGGFLASVIGTGIAWAAWGYLRWVTIRDGDFGQEPGVTASYRRAYAVLFAVVGTAMTTIGGAELLRALLILGGQIFRFGRPAGAPWPQVLVVSLTAVIVGVPLASFAWRRVNRAAEGMAEAELNAPGRKLALYGWLAVSATVMLVSLGYLLWRGLSALAGVAVANPRALWEEQLVWALAYLPVASVTWLSFGGMLRGDTGSVGESSQAATLRRLYHYSMSAIGLGAFWFGVTELLTLVISVVTRRPGLESLMPLGPRERFSLAAALTLIGGPMWWGYWWSQQARARQPEPAGRAERASIVRRVYLYGVLLVTAVIFFVGTGLAMLGASGATMSNDVPVVALMVALFWGGMHFLVIRGDERRIADSQLQIANSRLQTTGIPIETSAATVSAEGIPPVAAPAEPTPQPGPRRFERASLPTPAQVIQAQQAPVSNGPYPVLAVVDGADGVLGASLLAALRRALPPTVEYWPIGLNAAAQVAMLGALGGQPPPAVPADALSRATIILGPSDILTPGGLDGEVSPELAFSIMLSPARKLLLPPRDPRLRWVAAPDWPIERWIENAVIEAAAAVSETAD